MPGIKANQQKFLDTNFNSLGNTDAGITLTGVALVLAEIAGQFALDASNNLNRVDRVSSGSLTDSIVPLPLRYMGKTLVAEVSVNDYYKFVDKGVKGWKDKQGSNSEYSFKKGVKGFAGNSDFVNSLKVWLQKEGLKIKNTKVGIVERENRRLKNKDRKDPLTQRAIAVAGIIRRDGLKRTNFWTDAVNNLEETIKQQLETAFKIDVINSI